MNHEMAGILYVNPYNSFMRTTSYSDLRKNLSAMIDAVTADHEPIIITRDRGRPAAVLMSVTAGLGWFATNSVSGAFALSTLLHIGPLLALVLIVVFQTGLAFFGHNLVQAFERWAFPVLAVIFAITSVVIRTMSAPDPAAPCKAPTSGPTGSRPNAELASAMQPSALRTGSTAWSEISFAAPAGDGASQLA